MTINTPQSDFTLCRPGKKSGFITLIFLLLVNGCVQSVHRTLADRQSLSGLRTDSPYLKVHMRNGDAYILRGWSIPGDQKMISGAGERLNLNREKVGNGEFQIPIDSVVLCETNVVGTAGGAVVMSIITGASAALTIACAANPKMCFGSCPTFYISDGKEDVLQAEGFSSSVAPSLEQQDIDALFEIQPSRGNLQVTMVNEALETHVVRHVQLLAARRPQNGRVMLDDQGVLHQVTKIIEPSAARGPEGDFRQLVRRYDRKERFSLADSSDLAAKETVELVFLRSRRDRVGVVVASRATLVSTFLFYQTLAFMGTKAGDWIARLERGEKALTKIFADTNGPLGGIEVLYQNAGGEWQLAGVTGEHGPLATDLTIVPLGDLKGDSVHVRLRLSKGSWRLDYLALASIGESVIPSVISPSEVRRLGVSQEDTRKALLEESEVVTTFPGERITLGFGLPDHPEEFEFFLDTQGYYLEWMRDEWLREENDISTLRMFIDPAGMLRELAPEFKKHEAAMEKQFWRSRYVRQ